jgi:hypothetical protein
MDRVIVLVAKETNAVPADLSVGLGVLYLAVDFNRSIFTAESLKIFQIGENLGSYLHNSRRLHFVLTFLVLNHLSTGDTQYLSCCDVDE